MTEQARSEHDWSAVQDAIAAVDVTALLPQVETAVAALVPQDGELTDRISIHLGRSLAAMRVRAALTANDLAEMKDLGRRASTAGMDLAPVLSAAMLIEEAGFSAIEQGLPEVAAETMRLLWRLRLGQRESITQAVTSAYRETELQHLSTSASHLIITLHTLLSAPLEPIEVEAALRRLGMDPGRRHWVFVLKPHGELMPFMTRLLGVNSAPYGSYAPWDELVVGLSSVEPPQTISDAEGGIAGPVDSPDLHEAFVEARSAAQTAELFALPGVWSLAQLGLLWPVAADAQTGTFLERRYVAPLVAGSAPVEDLLTTLRVYLELARRRDLAAKALFVHPNTVTYRISRFLTLTGADLEDHTTLAELWWLFRHLDAQKRRDSVASSPKQR